MKLAAKQIDGYVKNPLSQGRGVLIYGPDEGAVREYAADIAKAVVDDPKDPFSVTELDEGALKEEPTRLSDELNAMNMMGGQRLVRLSAGSDKAGRLIAEIFDASMPEAFLLVVAGELTPRNALRATFEKHKQLHALACYRDEGYKLDAMIKQTLSQAGIRYQPAVMDYLAANLGSDRRVTRSELEKIVLYVGDAGELTLEDAMKLVGNNAELTLDDLAEALADGNWRTVERVLHKQLREGAQPIQVLRSWMRYFNRLHVLKTTQIQTKTSDEQVIKDYKPPIFFKQVPVLRRQLGLWRAPWLEQVLVMINEAERAAKRTGSAPDAVLQQTAFDILSLFHRSRRSHAAA